VFLATACFSFLSLSGCGGGGENTVIEAPAVEEDAPSIPGMTDEQYDKAMDADMQ